jgi:hypothetical protein
LGVVGSSTSDSEGPEESGGGSGGIIDRFAGGGIRMKMCHLKVSEVVPNPSANHPARVPHFFLRHSLRSGTGGVRYPFILIVSYETSSMYVV